MKHENNESGSVIPRVTSLDTLAPRAIYMPNNAGVGRAIRASESHPLCTRGLIYVRCASEYNGSFSWGSESARHVPLAQNS